MTDVSNYANEETVSGVRVNKKIANPDGSVSDFSKIVKVDSNNDLGIFDSLGNELGQISNANKPYVIVYVDSNGNYNVVDSKNNYIVKANIITTYGAGLGAGTAGASTQTAGIQEALNTGYVVHITQGFYKIYTGLEPHGGVLEGEGISYPNPYTGTYIQLASNISTNQAIYFAGSILTIRDLTVDVNQQNGNTNVVGIKIDTSASNIIVERCLVMNFNNHAIFVGGNNCVVSKCYFQNAGSVDSDSVGVVQGTGNVVTECQDLSNGYGFYAAGETSVIGNYILGRGIDAGGAQGVTISGNIVNSSKISNGGIYGPEDPAAGIISLVVSNNILINATVDCAIATTGLTNNAARKIVSNNLFILPSSLPSGVSPVPYAIGIRGISNVIVTGNYIYNHSVGVQIEAAGGFNPTNLLIKDNYFDTVATPISLGVPTNNIVIRDNPGYNPQTSLTLSTNPPASGTTYQNTFPFPIKLAVPITLNPTASAAATAYLRVGSSATAGANPIKDQVNEPAGLTGADGTIYTLKYDVQPGQYYEVDVTNATIGTAQADEAS